ncbi:MAG: shikimate dehydrogenase, partial [Cellvibrionaceae bacterium]
MSDLDQSVEHYAVFGNPIAHSKSPRLQQAFAQQTHQAMEYSAVCIPLDDFAVSVHNFFNDGGKGLNITVPFKQQAFELAQVLTPRAQLAGAVNTLFLDKDQRLAGDNTDGVGLITDLIDRLNWPITHKRLLILGAGGAVRGILQPIIEENPSMIVIANRTVEKARELVKIFSEKFSIQAVTYRDIPRYRFDLVLNGTSASLAGDLPPVPDKVIGEHSRCYDMVYGKQRTPFLQWASDCGARCLSDGLGMLVAQGAESFTIWRRRRPDIEPVIEMI